MTPSVHAAAIAALLAVLPRPAAAGEMPWGEGSRRWANIPITDVNGRKITNLWMHRELCPDSDVPLYQLTPTELGDKYQAERTRYLYQPKESVVTRDDSVYKAPVAPQDAPLCAMGFNLGAMTVLAPTLGAPVPLEITPFKELPGPVPSENILAAYAKKAETSKKPKAAAKLAGLFEPLELFLGDGKTIKDFSLLDDKDLLDAIDRGGAASVASDVADLRDHLITASADLRKQLTGNAAYPDGFVKDEDVLIIRFFSSVHAQHAKFDPDAQRGKFYAELQAAAAAGKLAPFVKKSRDTVIAKLLEYETRAKAALPKVSAAVPAAKVTPGVPERPGARLPPVYTAQEQAQVELCNITKMQKSEPCYSLLTRKGPPAPAPAAVTVPVDEKAAKAWCETNKLQKTPACAKFFPQTPAAGPAPAAVPADLQAKIEWCKKFNLGNSSPCREILAGQAPAAAPARVEVPAPAAPSAPPAPPVEERPLTPAEILQLQKAGQK